MRKTITKSSQRATLRLVGVGVGERASALSPFGPVRAGLITTPTQRTRTGEQDQQLTELLNCLERKITEANIKSLKVLNIFLNDTIPPAKHTSSFSNTTIIKYDSI